MEGGGGGWRGAYAVTSRHFPSRVGAMFVAGMGRNLIKGYTKCKSGGLRVSADSSWRSAKYAPVKIMSRQFE